MSYMEHNINDISPYNIVYILISILVGRSVGSRMELRDNYMRLISTSNVMEGDLLIGVYNISHEGFIYVMAYLRIVFKTRRTHLY